MCEVNSDTERLQKTSTDQHRIPSTNTVQNEPVQGPAQTSTDLCKVLHRPAWTCARTSTDQYGPVRTITDQYRPARTSTDLYKDQHRQVQTCARTCTDQQRTVQGPAQTGTDLWNDQQRPDQTSTDLHKDHHRTARTCARTSTDLTGPTRSSRDHCKPTQGSA